MLPRVRRLTLYKGGGFRTEDLFRPGDSGFYYDFSRPDGLMTLSTGPTEVAADADPVGLLFDRKGWRNKTRLSYVASLTERLATGQTYVTGTGSASYNTSTGVGSVTRVDFSNQGNVYFPAASESLFVVDIENTGSIPLTLRNSSTVGGTIQVSVAAGVRGVYYITGLNMGILGDGAGTLTFKMHSIKILPGRHASQGTSGQRPFFYTAGYARGDGLDDSLLTTFTPGAAGNTIMARVTVPASLSANQYCMGSFHAGTTERLLLGFSTAGHPIYGAGGNPSGGTVAVDYRGQTLSVALTEAGGQSVFYINGIQAATAAVTGAVPNLPLRLFAFTNSSLGANSFFNGDIYKALAINRALTPAEILRTHNLWSN